VSNRRILVVGLPFFGQKVAESLSTAGFDAKFQAHPGRSAGGWAKSAAELLRADVVYSIGSSVRRNSPLDMAARAGKQLLIHWVGTDVRVALDDWHAGAVSERVLHGGIHRADAPWLLDELAELGIRGQERLLPVPVAFGELAPLPEAFRVLVYLPASPQEDYDVAGTLAVMRALPNIGFTIVGGYSPPEPMANVAVLGYRTDMPAVFRESTVLLRLTNHDGMSHSVIEAASFGRYVAWQHAVRGVCQVANDTAAIEAIERLHSLHLDHQLQPNAEGAEYMHTTYNHERVLAAISHDLERLLS